MAGPYPSRRIYSVVGVPPEIQAYAMAKYSRSGQGMLESIQELSQAKAEQFLNTFYFQYGHRSIADLAHLVFGLEQVSILAAMAVVDEQVWDGQERSTRYQPFRKTGWFSPGELAATAAEPIYHQTAEGLFAAYEQLTAELLERLVDAVPRPPDMPETVYRRTLRARAFDVGRSLLPLATHTSVGQVVSARVLERQISRLLAAPYAELQSIGEELRAACQLPSASPLLERVVTDGDPALAELLRPRAAPTLVKYAQASEYAPLMATELAQAADSYLGAAGEPDGSRAVELAEPAADPLDEIAATLLYKHDRAGHSYRQTRNIVTGMSAAQKAELLNGSVKHRGDHDELLREHQAGYALIFDVLMDLGSFRDLHRHRRCVQVQQPLTWRHQVAPVEDVFRAGLGDAAALGALEGNLGEVYLDSLARAEQAAAAVRAVAPLASDYLLPLAYRTRCLFKMDWAQAAYLIELRTGSAGHFSYRRVAWSMYRALKERYPPLAAPIRATDPYGPLDLLER